MLVANSVRCLHELTGFGLVLLVLVNEKKPGALGTKRQQDALDHSGDEGEAQQEWPQFPVAHDRLQSKHLSKKKPKITYFRQ